MSKPVPGIAPCPFCGGEATIEQSFSGGPYVLCDDCGAATMFSQTEAEAIAAWNGRTADQHIERLTSALEGLADVVEHDSGCPPCVGSMDPAEHYLGLAREALSLIKEGKSHGEG